MLLNTGARCAGLFRCIYYCCCTILRLLDEEYEGRTFQYMGTRNLTLMRYFLFSLSRNRTQTKEVQSSRSCSCKIEFWKPCCPSYILAWSRQLASKTIWMSLKPEAVKSLENSHTSLTFCIYILNSL